MTKMLENKAALITGGASGIGESAVRIFVREGARVLIADRNAARGEALTAELRSAGADVHFRRVDVTDEAQVEAMVGEVVSRFGRIDCAFNNAGITGASVAFEDATLEDWRRVIDVDLTSVFLCMKHEIRAMKRQGGGAIVNTSSGAGVIGVPRLPAYCAAKHAVLGLTRTAAIEYSRSNIRVNAVLPGSTDTPMMQDSLKLGPEAVKLIMGSIPCGRMGRPEEIAEAVAWLCSDRASYVSGDSMLVDMATVAR